LDEQEPLMASTIDPQQATDRLEATVAMAGAPITRTDVRRSAQSARGHGRYALADALENLATAMLAEQLREAAERADAAFIARNAR
jgi:hypothetical protein